MEQYEKIENFVNKSKLLGIANFTVDAHKGIMLGCDAGQYDKLLLPPVEIIEKDAFVGVTAKELVIPETVKLIKRQEIKLHLVFAHRKCSIDTLTILGNIKIEFDFGDFWDECVRVVSIGEKVSSYDLIDWIDNCKQLEKVNVASDNKCFTSKDGVVYNKDLTKLLVYPRRRKQQVYIMPNTVKGTLKECTFNEVSWLKRLKLSDNITELEQYSITECTELEELELGEHLETFNMEAMCNLPALKKIKVGKGFMEMVNMKSGYDF